MCTRSTRPDASDPVEEKSKRRSRMASTFRYRAKHEWVVDFNPVVQKLGLSKWALECERRADDIHVGTLRRCPLYPKEDQAKQRRGELGWQKTAGVLPRSRAACREAGVHREPSERHSVLVVFLRRRARSCEGIWIRGCVTDEFGAVEVFNDSSLDENRTAIRSRTISRC